MIDASLFERFTPLASLAPNSRTRLALRAELREADTGDILFDDRTPSTDALYLLSGCVQLQRDTETGSVVRGGDAHARHALTAVNRRHASARCLSHCRYLAIDADLLDVTLTWDQGGALAIGDAGSHATGDDGDWMVRLLQLPVFHRVPPANLYSMFRRFESITASAGDVLIRQGDHGDYFYVIVEGRCEVTQHGSHGAVASLAVLEIGACFGEDALISEEPRAATVVLLTDARLMRLTREDFRSLLSDPLARFIGREDAAARVAAGISQWLDVRLPSEFRDGSIEGSINLPLHLLRPRLAMLDRNLSYVTICDTGRRSSLAAWLLNQRGIDTWHLQSGESAAELPHDSSTSYASAARN